MKLPILAIACVAFSALAAHAQTAPQVKVKVTAPKLSNIQTPQMQANNVPNKNWRPKEWLEFDTEFAVTLPQSAGGRNGALANLVINYYVAMNAQTKDGKYPLLKGSITYVDVPAGERCHALAYITPATLRRVLGKDSFTAASDIKASAIEIVVDGAVVGGETTVPGKWWEKAESFESNENVVLSRKETPFDILWGDYDVPTKAK